MQMLFVINLIKCVRILLIFTEKQSRKMPCRAVNGLKSKDADVIVLGLLLTVEKKLRACFGRCCAMNCR